MIVRALDGGGCFPGLIAGPRYIGDEAPGEGTITSGQGA
jgi:hypothetical protein